LLVLFVAAVFEPFLFWVYAGVGSALLAAVFVHKYLALKRQVSQLQYEPRVLSVGRMRRLVRQVNTKGSKFWRLLPSTKVIGCFVAVSVAALLVGAVIGASLVRIRNVGVIRAVGVEVYADEGLSTVLTEIAWGTLDPGETKTFDAWVKNTGNSPQKLVLWTENWVPTSAQDTISLTWDYDDGWIAAGASIPVVFTLSVDSNISGVTDFSFDIRIQGVA
jgi:hypothetical protein